MSWQTKRYVVFAGDAYYPGGGWDDFVGSYDTTEDAFAKAKSLKSGWSQVVDLNLGKPIDATGSPTDA